MTSPVFLNVAIRAHKRRPCLLSVADHRRIMRRIWTFNAILALALFIAEVVR